MALNSFYFDDLGVPHVTRATMLGQTELINRLKYTYPKAAYVSEVTEMMNGHRLTITEMNLATQSNANSV